MRVQVVQEKADKGKPLRVEVREMSSQGVVTMRYSDKVRNTSEVNTTVLDVKVRENPEISGNKTILSWNVTRVTDREYDLFLLFAEPGQISNDKVTFCLNSFFRLKTFLRSSSSKMIPYSASLIRRPLISTIL
jgi:hypothetical protein